MLLITRQSWYPCTTVQGSLRWHMHEAIPKDHVTQLQMARGSETLRTGTKKSMHFTVAEPW